MAKVGRKSKDYRDPDTGIVYNGLGRRPTRNGTPGRFYAIGDSNVTFGTDPKIAKYKYEAYLRKKSGERGPFFGFALHLSEEDLARKCNVFAVVHKGYCEETDKFLKLLADDGYHEILVTEVREELKLPAIEAITRNISRNRRGDGRGRWDRRLESDHPAIDGIVYKFPLPFCWQCHQLTLTPQPDPIVLSSVETTSTVIYNRTSLICYEVGVDSDQNGAQ